MGGKNIPVGFLSVQTCCCLWLLSKATYNSDHGHIGGVYFMKKGERKGNIVDSVYGVPAKEDELHRKSTCELDLLKMSSRIL